MTHVGLFERDRWKGSPLAKFRDGMRFWIPGTPRQVIGVLSSYGRPDQGIGELGFHIRDYLEKYGNQFGITAAEPDGMEVYVAFVSERKVLVRAGSAAFELWHIDIDITPSGSGCELFAQLIPTSSSDDPLGLKWYGNITHVFFGIRGAAELAGGRSVGKNAF